MTEPTFFEVDEGDEQDEAERVELVAAQAELRARLTAAHLPFDVRTDEEDNSSWIIAEIPAGRERRPVTIVGLDRTRAWLKSPFERYKLISDYMAIWSAEDDVIEAAAEPLSRAGTTILFRRLTGKSLSLLRTSGDDLSISVTPQQDGRSEVVTFGVASSLLSALAGRSVSTGRTAAIRLAGFRVVQHDQAKDLLERVANSLFFEIDHLTYVPLALARERRPQRNPVPLPADSAPKLQFPKYEYDKGPLALYWYGRSAVGMPLLQFLAYYQVLEFYFPVFSRVEAQRRIRTVLKDPLFDPQRDSDIGRILTAVRVGAGKSFGDERAQLRATLQECIPDDELREYIESDADRLDFFSKKSDILGVAALPLKSPSADLRLAVADRIYSIRCKIVHTKSIPDDDGQIDLLLPFSREAEALSFDIGLVQLVARRALVASSSPLHVGSQ